MCLFIYHFLQKSNDALMMFFNFSSRQNGLRIRNNH
jgi:hypothetical protein